MMSLPFRGRVRVARVAGAPIAAAPIAAAASPAVLRRRRAAVREQRRVPPGFRIPQSPRATRERRD